MTAARPDAAAFFGAERSRVDQVHLVFKTHVDVGFTDFAANVLRQYREVYIPAALRTAADLRAAGETERLVWTVPAWIVWDALEQGDRMLRAAVESGIALGDLTWHALPFTYHSELLDEALFRHGLTIAGRLDRRFGKKTIAAKMTDVPGHTRGIVPLLAEAGVELLHIGVNEASRMPDVPPAFRWRAGGAEIIVLYQHGYGADFTLDGLGAALSFAHTHDNLGPQDAAAVQAAFAAARAAFPGATPVASTLDDFAVALRTVRHTLPVVEDEIGDSWIHGAASDPAKLAGFRALCRLHSAWRAEDPADDPALAAFADNLLLVPEHTWGLDHKTHLYDWTSYAAEDFAAARRKPDFQAMEQSWQEQRDYLSAAMASLAGVRRQQASAELAAVTAAPTLSAGSAIATGTAITLGRFQLRVSKDGGLAQLLDQESGRDWSRGRDLFRVWWEGFGVAEYEAFWNAYIANADNPEVRSWAEYDFQKPGLARSRPAHGARDFRIADLTADADGRKLRIVLASSAEAKAAGAPGRVELRYVFDARKPAFHLDLFWRDKLASRLPEATWLSFDPAMDHPDSWRLD